MLNVYIIVIQKGQFPKREWGVVINENLTYRISY